MQAFLQFCTGSVVAVEVLTRGIAYSLFALKTMIVRSVAYHYTVILKLGLKLGVKPCRE